MCLLIVLRGAFASHPLLVASNRDERTDRRASPPGLFVGRRLRMISPRDRVAGGTWLAVDERGRFAGLTNVTGAPVPEGATTRGELPHLALDEEHLDGAVAAVTAAVRQRRYAGFQLVLADAERTVVLRQAGGVLERVDWPDRLLVVSNEHAPGTLMLPGLEAALDPAPAPLSQLDRLRPLLRDPGGAGQHAVLKRAAGYGTVSSSLVAVPAQDPAALVWLYAPGPPDVTEYRNYGNLGRRLLPDQQPLPSDRGPES